jgi:hypothetical protein
MSDVERASVRDLASRSEEKHGHAPGERAAYALACQAADQTRPPERTELLTLTEPRERWRTSVIRAYGADVVDRLAERAGAAAWARARPVVDITAAAVDVVAVVGSRSGPPEAEVQGGEEAGSGQAAVASESRAASLCRRVVAPARSRQNRIGNAAARRGARPVPAAALHRLAAVTMPDTTHSIEPTRWVPSSGFNRVDFTLVRTAMSTAPRCAHRHLSPGAAGHG